MNSAKKTDIDLAYAEMMRGGETELLAFYKTLMQSDIYLLLDDGPKATSSEPKLVKLDGSWFVLAFDSEERVANFVEVAVQPMKLPGRWLFSLLHGRSAGIALNMGSDDTAIQIPSDAVDWAFESMEAEEAVAEEASISASQSEEQTTEDADASSTPPPSSAGRLKAFMTPKNFPDGLLAALRSSLSDVANKFESALLLRAEYDDGISGYILGLTGVEQSDRTTLIAAIGRAVNHSGRSDITLDITFLTENAGNLGRMGDVALVVSERSK